MAIGFLIMQIGNAEMDAICEEVFVPALAECGLEAKRVDKHNRGELLKSEIIRFIETADIVIADLTNERQNCYLEIGYAMGIGKFSNLILTCRDDHRADSSAKRLDGPRVHFDLAGYDILFWHTDQASVFKNELVKRIRRRLAILANTPAETEHVSLQNQWLNTQREIALAGLKSMGFGTYMEVRFTLVDERISRKPAELLQVADSAQIRAFGWPIGVVLMNDDEAKPRPTADGITSEIKSEAGLLGPSYDYWTLRRDGGFFLLHSLFEDSMNPKAVFFDTRITRVTEAVLYCARLYNRLGIVPSAQVKMSIKHAGLRGRLLLSGNPHRLVHPRSAASGDLIETSQTFSLSEVEARLVDIVKAFTAPIFEIFEFSEFHDDIYTQIVDGFMKDMQAERSRP
jgi:nucleoside 2-deoxyribosyltransferase